MEFKNIKTFVAYPVLIAISLLIAYFLIWPSLPEIKNNQKELFKAKLTFQEKENTLQEFKRISKKYIKSGKDIKKIDQLLLTEPDLPLILIQLEALAAESKIEIITISFSVLEKSDKEVGILPVDLEIKGDYNSFKNFLEAIAKNLNIMEVENITLRAGEGEEKGIYSFSLKINVYTQKLPKVEEEAASPAEGQEKLPKE